MVLAKSRQAGSCAVEACAPGCAPQSQAVYPARRRAARRSTPAAPGARQPPAACMRSFSRPRVEPLLDRSRRNSLDALSYGRRTPRTCCAAAAHPLGPLPAPRRRRLHTALGLSVAPCRRQSLESPAQPWPRSLCASPRPCAWWRPPRRFSTPTGARWLRGRPPRCSQPNCGRWNAPAAETTQNAGCNSAPRRYQQRATGCHWHQPRWRASRQAPAAARRAAAHAHT